VTPFKPTSGGHDIALGQTFHRTVRFDIGDEGNDPGGPVTRTATGGAGTHGARRTDMIPPPQGAGGGSHGCGVLR